MDQPKSGWKSVDVGVNAVAVWLGIILLLPAETFASNKSFNVMALIAPEWLWGLGLFLVGLCGTLSKAFPYKWVRLGALSAVSGAHFLFALCLLLSNPINTGSGTYLIIAGLAFALLMHETNK